jgi:hypothetical protein
MGAEGVACEMEKWLNGLGVLMMVLFGLIYVGAKIHFFTRYALLEPTGYLEEHWPFGVAWRSWALRGHS